MPPKPMRLEGLCQQPEAGECGPRLRFGSGADGIERLEASFRGQAFSPHRHDTYAIGVTVAGVQTFRYRGERRQCLPGEGHVLHPDELHDGRAGTEDGFSYRIVYVDPRLVQQALGGRPLPFVADPIIDRRHMGPALLACIDDTSESIEDFERHEIATVIADELEKHASPSAPRRAPLRLTSLLLVRDLIAEVPATAHSAEELEKVSGLDRWTIARQFRAAFGTSPSRFRTMRQLDLARRLIAQGARLSEASLEAGFADQSHMCRMFKRTYGLTPARWAVALGRLPLRRPLLSDSTQATCRPRQGLRSIT